MSLGAMQLTGLQLTGWAIRSVFDIGRLLVDSLQGHKVSKDSFLDE